MKTLAGSVHATVLRHFIYTPDQEQYGRWEHWESHADEVERGEIFRQDCDGFSLTCGELLLRAGVAPSLIRIALCHTETGTYHAVCIVDGWVLDNRQRAVWRWDQLPYKWDKSMGMDELGVWRES